MENRQIRFVLELPDPEDFRLTNHSPPEERSARAQREAHDQACRQKWRALLLVVKAKLEAVSAGISTLEAEFLANIVPARQQQRRRLDAPPDRPGLSHRPDAAPPAPGSRSPTIGPPPIPLPPA